MIIVLNDDEKQIFPQFKGGEGEMAANMFFDGRNRILHATLSPGSTIGYHTHETNSEIIYLLSGSGKVLINDGEERVEAGQCHYCPQGHSHSLINDGDVPLTFFAVVPEQS